MGLRSRMRAPQEQVGREVRELDVLDFKGTAALNHRARTDLPQKPASDGSICLESE